MIPETHCPVFYRDGFIFVLHCPPGDDVPRTLAIFCWPSELHVRDNRLYGRYRNTASQTLLLNVPGYDASAVLTSIKQAKKRFRLSVLRHYLKAAVVSALISIAMIVFHELTRPVPDYSPCHMDCLGGLG
ncbi:TPA: hypothetical protein JG951_003177 [Enterobacter hormaechei subsp. steigerwaltii]|nr:hypothetical protein [Enterobacter hormaechei subsp. steigerwaltii]